MTRAGFHLTLSEFVDLEYVVGLMETDGTEEFVLSRFGNGELGLKVITAGEEGATCRLGDWAQGIAVKP